MDRGTAVKNMVKFGAGPQFIPGDKPFQGFARVKVRKKEDRPLQMVFWKEDVLGKRLLPDRPSAVFTGCLLPGGLPGSF
jgi:hypothetical protein